MWDKAMGHYWAAIAIKPDYAEPHLYLGEAYEHKGFHEEAAEEYRAALELMPGARDAEEGLARVIVKLKISGSN
jgi:tetratricopeptide (TPR) repeat protein